MDSESKGSGEIKKVKYFLKHIIRAREKLGERENAKKEIDSHLIELKNVPGISKTKRVDSAVDELRRKLYEVVGKEMKLEKDKLNDSKKIEELQGEVGHLKEIISGHTVDVAEKKIEEVKIEIRKAERLYEDLQKGGGNKRELNRINKKIEELKNKIN